MKSSYSGQNRKKCLPVWIVLRARICFWRCWNEFKMVLTIRGYNYCQVRWGIGLILSTKHYQKLMTLCLKVKHDNICIRLKPVQSFILTILVHQIEADELWQKRFNVPDSNLKCVEISVCKITLYHATMIDRSWILTGGIDLSWIKKVQTKR